MTTFPELAPDWLPTRDTLQGYSQVLGAVRRHLAPPLPHWWHISLTPAPLGLTTGAIALADTRELSLTLDLVDHTIRVKLDGSELASLALDDGLSSRALGERVLGACLQGGAELPDDFNSRENDDERRYDPAAARTYLGVLLATHEVFEKAHEGFESKLGPIQLWPHHFDLSFEWFGERMIATGEGESPSQIGFGFSTGDASHPGAYYYATPWPFAGEFTEASLPAGASWQTEGWQGGLLPYAEVERAGGELLGSFLARVYEVAKPRLVSE